MISQDCGSIYFWGLKPHFCQSSVSFGFEAILYGLSVSVQLCFFISSVMSRVISSVTLVPISAAQSFHKSFVPNGRFSRKDSRCVRIYLIHGVYAYTSLFWLLLFHHNSYFVLPCLIVYSIINDRARIINHQNYIGNYMLFLKNTKNTLTNSKNQCMMPLMRFQTIKKTSTAHQLLPATDGHN